MDQERQMLMYRWCLEQMVTMVYNHRKRLNKKWCNCNECPLCYSKRALDYDFDGQEYINVFTEAIKAVDGGDLTEGLRGAVFELRTKVASEPERRPRDGRGRTPAGGVEKLYGQGSGSVDC